MIVASTPSVQLFAGVFEAQEPASIEAHNPELAVESFYERVVGRLAWTRDVERDVVLISPKIEIAKVKLRALIDPDPLGIDGAPASLVERSHDILSSVGEAGIRRWSVS